MSIPGSRRDVTLVEFFAEEENRNDYVKWLKDPLTRRFLDLTEASLRPVFKPADMDASRYSGLVDGRYEALRVLTHLDKIFAAIQAAQSAVEIPETYGEDEVLRSSWGVTEAMVKKANAKSKKQVAGREGGAQ